MRSTWGGLRRLRGTVGAALVASAALVAVAGLGGCGDEPLPGDDASQDALGQDLPLADGAADSGTAGDGVTDAGQDLAQPDEGQTDQAQTDEGQTDEGPAPDATPDVSADAQADTAPDDTPPTVVSTTPADGEGGVAIPFVVTVTFSEPMYETMIAAQTVKLFDEYKVEIPMKRELDETGTVLTLTPTLLPEKFAHLSPYRLWITGGILTDLAGNKLAEPFEATFFTEGLPNPSKYAALAAQYAPTIRSRVAPDLGGDTKTQVPVRVNLDGDWDLSNNHSYIFGAISEVTPAVYYAVAETRSHYFLRYMYYFPLNRDGDLVWANGVSGAMVVVQKAQGEQPERPILVTTYYKDKQIEENLAYATTESGIVGPRGESFYRVDGTFDQATLFPGGHYEAFIAPGTHASCLWIIKDAPQPPACYIETSQLATMTMLTMGYTDGTATTVAKVGNKWPASNADMEGSPELIGYELVPLEDELWPRRLMVSDHGLWGADITYQTDPNRPGDGRKIPSKFVDPLTSTDTSYGRPVWAWKWNPAMGGVIGIPQGAMGMDPAWYVWKRHSSVDNDNAFTAWDGQAHTGLSLDYCYLPILDIDQRTEPGCL